MCRSHDQGHRRCKGSADTKASESLRKAISYQATKAGVSVYEWKEQNPDLLEVIHNSYDTRLKKFKQKEVAQTSFSGSNGETLLTGIQTPESAAKENPITKYKFMGKGELRPETLSEDLPDYQERAKAYTQALKLNKPQKHAILCYSNDRYVGLNSYLLNENFSKGIFNEHTRKWKDSEYGWEEGFSDEEDLIDFSKKLDSVLSHRVEEPRFLYRGMGIHSGSHLMLTANGGKEVMETKDRRKILESTYTPGAELDFDAYSSASDAIDTATSWCGIGDTWHDPPTGVLFEIKSSAGVPITHLSGHADEREVLLPRGMRFKVVNSYWNSNKSEECYKFPAKHSEISSKNPNTLIVQLVEIDENGNDVVDHSVKYKAPPLVVKSQIEKNTENSA